MEKKRDPNKEMFRRVFFVSFLLTLLCCLFVLFSGLALRNTVAVMYGSDIRVVDIAEAEQARPIYQVELLQNQYEVDLSGLNDTAKLLQEHYALVPFPLRLAAYLGNGLKQLAEGFL